MYLKYFKQLYNNIELFTSHRSSSLYETYTEYICTYNVYVYRDFTNICTISVIIIINQRSLLPIVLQDFLYLFVDLFSHEVKLTIGVGIHRIIGDAASTLIFKRPSCSEPKMSISPGSVWIQGGSIRALPHRILWRALIALGADCASGERIPRTLRLPLQLPHPSLVVPLHHPLHHVTVGHFWASDLPVKKVKYSSKNAYNAH
jgi:hypothetical protein